MRKRIFTFALFLTAWIGMAGFNTSELLMGAIVSLGLTVIVNFSDKSSFGGNSLVSSLKFIFVYIPVFLVKLIQSNLKMAKVVLMRDLKIRPGFVRIGTKLDSEAGRITLANSITLTPGTVTVDVVNDYLLVHWIDVMGDDESIHAENISSDFEKVLGGIFR